MRRLLFEIGCEELPGGGVHGGGAAAAGARRASTSARRRSSSSSGRGGSPSRPTSPSAPRTSGSRARPRTCASGRPPASRSATASSVDDLSVRDGFLGVEVPGRPIEEVLPERLAAIVTGLQFTKSMTWGAGFRFARPVRWLCAKLDDTTIEVPLEGVPSGGCLLRSSRDASRAGRDRVGRRLPRRAARRRCRAGPRRALRADRRRARRARRRGATRSASSTRSSTSSRRRDVLEGSFDERFLRLPERVVVTTMQSHQRYFPLGGNRFAFVANGGDPDVVRAGNEFVLSGRLEDAEFTFERDVAIGIDGLAERTKSITFFTGGGTFADKAERLATLVVELGGDEAAVAGGQAREGRSGGRARAGVQRPRGPHRRDVRPARRLPATTSCRRSTSSTCRTAPAAPLPQLRGPVRCSPPPTSSTRCASRSTSASDRPAHATRSACAARRSASAGSRPKAGCSIERSLLPDDVREFVEERLEGLLDVPVEFVRAARASAAADLGGVARLAEGLHAAERQRRLRVRCTRPTTVRSASPASATTRRRRSTRRSSSTTPSVSSPPRVAGLELDPSDVPACARAGRHGRADRLAVLRRRDGGRRRRRRPRQPPAPAARRARPAGPARRPLADPALVLGFAVVVLERFDASDHAEAAPRDLVRARVVTHVVRLSRPVDQHREPVVAGEERVGDPGRRRSRDHVTWADRDVLALDAVPRRPR